MDIQQISKIIFAALVLLDTTKASLADTWVEWGIYMLFAIYSMWLLLREDSSIGGGGGHTEKSLKRLKLVSA